MHVTHTMSGNQNSNVLDNMPSCNGCRELKREVEELKRVIGQVMDTKPDMPNVSTLLALAQQQRSLLQQQIIPDSPFVQTLLPNWNNLLRLISNGGLNQANPAAGLHFQHQVDGSHIWSPLQSMPTAVSNGNIDVAHANNSVDMNVDNTFVDNLGIEGSETSSSTSSANAQAVISPKNQQEGGQESSSNKNGSAFTSTNGKGMFDSVHRAMTSNLFNIGQLPSSMPSSMSASSGIAAAVASMAAQSKFSNLQQTPIYSPIPLPMVQFPSTMGRPHSRQNGGSGGPVGNISEKRKASTDDFVKNIRQCQMSLEDISKIEIPVPEALKYDQNFRPVSEEQIIQQIMTSKKYESMDVLETMIQLCKKLAEKRVFGSRLMADTTVAAPNHSNYTNLPDKGIIYILHVCQRVLGPRVKTEDEFWEYFRDAMRKLAARCRRVRHAKKMRSSNLQNQSDVSPAFSKACEASSSIFASAHALIAEDEKLINRQSTATATNLLLSRVAGAIKSSPSSPLSMVTSTSSNTSPTEPVTTEGCSFLSSA